MPPADYRAQLAQKQAYLLSLFAGFALPPLAVFDSPPQHYRMRAEFRLWHDGDDCCYAMFMPGQKPSAASLIRLHDFPAAHENINALMPVLLAALKTQAVLIQRLYQVEFLTTLSGQTLVTLIYHKKLDDAWAAAAKNMATALGIDVVGRSRGQKVVVGRDYVVETLSVDGRQYHYQQIEASFTQPNAQVCEKMLAWAGEVAAPLGGDLLELYCGNGNFTLPLAQYFRRVLATELSKTSVSAAQWSMAANGIDNIAIARLSAEEFTQAWRGEREFARLQQQGVVLADYAFSTVFVDPPRAGIDAATLALLQQFDNIIYISCNPHTLRNNAAQLVQTHDIRRMALFDQFPFTEHIEAGMYFARRG